MGPHRAKRRQRGFVHVLLFVMLFMGITTYGVVYLQGELTDLRTKGDIGSKVALQAAKKGLLDYARAIPTAPQQFRDQVRTRPHYDFYSLDSNEYFQYARYLVSRPGQLPCPDLANTSWTFATGESYYAGFLSGWDSPLLGYGFVDDGDRRLDGIADPGLNMCSFEPNVIQNQLINGSFFGRYPYGEYADLGNYVRGAGVTDIRDGYGNRLFYAASPNILNAHWAINPYRIQRTNENWLNLEASRVDRLNDRTFNYNIGGLAAVVIAPNYPNNPTLGNDEDAYHGKRGGVRIDYAVSTSVGEDLVEQMLDDYQYRRYASSAYEFSDFQDAAANSRDHATYITRDELLASFRGIDSSRNLDAIADALLAFYQRNDYLPEPATFEASGGQYIARRLGRPADSIPFSGPKFNIGFAATYDNRLAVFDGRPGIDSDTREVLDNTDIDGLRHAIQGGRVQHAITDLTYPRSGSFTDVVFAKDNAVLVTGALAPAQVREVYLPLGLGITLGTPSAGGVSPAGTEETNMMAPPFGIAQLENQDLIAASKLDDRDRTPFTVPPGTPLLLGAPTYFRPAADHSATGYPNSGFASRRVSIEFMHNVNGAFNALFPDGRPGLVGNLARLGYEIYLPAGTMLRSQSSVQLLERNLRVNAANNPVASNKDIRLFELASQNVEFVVGVTDDAGRSTPPVPPAVPDGTPLTPGSQGLLPTPLFPQQLPAPQVYNPQRTTLQFLPRPEAPLRPMAQGVFNQGADWQRQLGAVKSIPFYNYNSQLVLTDRQGLAFGYYPTEVTLHQLFLENYTHLTGAAANTPGTFNTNIRTNRTYPASRQAVITPAPLVEWNYDQNTLVPRQRKVEFESLTPDTFTFEGWIALPPGAKFLYPFGTRVPIGPEFSQSHEEFTFGSGGPLRGITSDPPAGSSVTVMLPPGTVVQNAIYTGAHLDPDFQRHAAAREVPLLTLRSGGIMAFSQLLHYHNGDYSLQPLTPEQAAFRIESMGAVLMGERFPLTLATPVATVMANPGDGAMKELLDLIHEPVYISDTSGTVAINTALTIRPLDPYIPLADGYYIYPYHGSYATMSRRTYPFLHDIGRTATSYDYRQDMELRTNTVYLRRNRAPARQYIYRAATTYIENLGSRADVLAYPVGRHREYIAGRGFFDHPLHDACGTHTHKYTYQSSFYYVGGDARPRRTQLSSLNSNHCDMILLRGEQNRYHLGNDLRVQHGDSPGFKSRYALVDQFGVGIENSTGGGTEVSIGSLNNNPREVLELPTLALFLEPGLRMQASRGVITGGNTDYFIYLDSHENAYESSPFTAPFDRGRNLYGLEGASLRIYGSAVIGGATVRTTTFAALDGRASEIALNINELGYGSFNPSYRVRTGTLNSDRFPDDTLRFAGESSNRFDSITVDNRSLQLLTIREPSYLVQRNFYESAVSTSLQVTPGGTTMTVSLNIPTYDTSGDYRHYERRVIFSFNSDAVARDRGLTVASTVAALAHRRSQVTHLPRGTKLEYGVMLQPSDHNQGSCFGWESAADSRETELCDNHFIPSGRAFRGVGFTPIPRRAAVVFNQPQTSLPLLGGRELTIEMRYEQVQGQPHVCHDTFRASSWWERSPWYGSSVQVGDRFGASSSQESIARVACLYDWLDFTNSGDPHWEHKVLRSGSYGETFASVFFTTVKDGAKITVVKDHDTRWAQFSDTSHLTIRLSDVRLHIPAGAAFSAGQVDFQEGRLFLDADVALIGTGTFKNCTTFRSNGSAILTTSYKIIGIQFTIAKRTNLYPWPRDCIGESNVNLRDAVFPSARHLLKTMPTAKKLQAETDNFFRTRLTLYDHWTPWGEAGGSMHLYIVLPRVGGNIDWSAVKDLQAVFPTYGGGNIMYMGRSNLGYPDYGVRHGKNEQSQPYVIDSIKDNQLMVMDMLADNEGLRFITPRVLMSWSGRDSEWNSMDFEPDALAFAQNNPMFYAVARECRSETSIDAQDCVLGADQGLQVNVRTGQELRLPEEMVVPEGLVIHGYRGPRQLATPVNLLVNGTARTVDGLLIETDGRLRRLQADSSSINRLLVASDYIGNPGDEVVVYNEHPGLEFRLENPALTGFDIDVSPRERGYLQRLTLIAGGYTYKNAGSSRYRLTLVGGSTLQTSAGSSIFTDRDGRQIGFAPGSRVPEISITRTPNNTISLPAATVTTYSIQTVNTGVVLDLAGYRSVGNNNIAITLIGLGVEAGRRLQPPQQFDFTVVSVQSSAPSISDYFEIFTEPQVISINKTPAQASATGPSDDTGYAWSGYILGDPRAQLRFLNPAAGPGTVTTPTSTLVLPTVIQTLFVRNYGPQGDLFPPPSTGNRPVDVAMPSHYAMDSTEFARRLETDYVMTDAANATTLSAPCMLACGNTITINVPPDQETDGTTNSLILATISIASRVLTGSLAHGNMELFNQFLHESSFTLEMDMSAYVATFQGPQPPATATATMVVTATNVGPPNVTTFITTTVTTTLFPPRQPDTYTTYYDSDGLITLTLANANSVNVSVPLAGTIQLTNHAPRLRDGAAANLDGFYTYALSVYPTGVVTTINAYSPPTTSTVAATSTVTVSAAPNSTITTDGTFIAGFMLAGSYGLVIENAADYGQIITTGGQGFRIRGPLAVHQTPGATDPLAPVSGVDDFFVEGTRTSVGPVTVTLSRDGSLAFHHQYTSTLYTLAAASYTLAATSFVPAGATASVTVTLVDMAGPFVITQPALATISNIRGTLAIGIIDQPTVANNVTTKFVNRDQQLHASYFIDESMFLDIPPHDSVFVGLQVPVPEVVTDKDITLLAGSIILPNYGSFGAVIHAQAFDINAPLMLQSPLYHCGSDPGLVGCLPADQTAMQVQLIAGGGSGRPMVYTQPAQHEATVFAAAASEEVTLSYEVSANISGSPRVVTNSVVVTIPVDGNTRVVMQNPVLQQTVVDMRLMDAVMHRQGGYTPDLLQEEGPYPLPYMNKITYTCPPDFCAMHVPIRPHPSKTLAPTVGVYDREARYDFVRSDSGYLPPRSGYESKYLGGIMVRTTPEASNEQLDYGFYPRLDAGMNILSGADTTIEFAASSSPGLKFVPSRIANATLVDFYDITVSAEQIAVVTSTAQQVTAVARRIPGLEDLYTVNVTLSVISRVTTTVNPGIVFPARLATELAADGTTNLAYQPLHPFGGAHSRYEPITSAYRQNLWVRLVEELTVEVSGGASVTLKKDAVINPLLGTYVNPLELPAEEVKDLLLPVRGHGASQRQMVLTRAGGHLPRGLTIQINRDIVFDQVKAVLAHSPRPLPESVCASRRDGTNQVIDQLTDYARGSGSTRVLPDYQANYEWQQAGSTIVADFYDNEPNVGDADICMLNELPENTDFDEVFEFVNGSLYDRASGRERANNEMRLVGGRMR